MDIYLVFGILVFFCLLEILNGHLKRSKRSSSDWIQEAGIFLVLASLIKPLIFLIVMTIGHILFADLQGIIKHWSLGISLLFFLLIDDLLQYWYHRSAHEYPFLWKLHRPHHQAEEMGFFVSYRNAGLYYLMMPNIWWMALVTFIGGGFAVAIGLIFKQVVIISSHSTVKWDKPLYKITWLRPFISIIERIFITPAFHHGHHGKSQIDGISEPNGNYGNMLSIWDQLFGSAYFTRQFPDTLGLLNDPKEHWTATLFYPFIKSKDSSSELSPGFKKQPTLLDEPITVNLEKDTNYLWCQCGKSKNQPFCDGSHHGSKFKPLFFTVNKKGTRKVCNCKRSKTKPFCDNTHLSI